MTGYFRRMHSYLREMFPLGKHLALAAVSYLAVAAFARHLVDEAGSAWTFFLPLGIWSYLAVPLLLRLMDELKDADIDRDLFPDRPLPSGRVRESDIRISVGVVTILFVGANSLHPPTLLAALVIAGYAWLMFCRFFAEKAHRGSLPLTLATHNPIVPLSLSYGFVLFSVEQGVGLERVDLRAIALFVLWLWMPFLAWELSRKIRSPVEEDEYVTYSQLLGRRGAVLVVLVVQILGVAAAAALCALFDAGWGLLVLPVGAWIVNAWAARRFVRDPTPVTSRLRPFAELFVTAVLVSTLLVFGKRLW